MEDAATPALDLLQMLSNPAKRKKVEDFPPIPELPHFLTAFIRTPLQVKGNEEVIKAEVKTTIVKIHELKACAQHCKREDVRIQLDFKRADNASTRSAATTQTIPMPQLKVRFISSAVIPPDCAIHLKISGTCQLLASRVTPKPSGRTLGMFSVKPPPVMWASAWTPPARMAARQLLWGVPMKVFGHGN